MIDDDHEQDAEELSEAQRRTRHHLRMRFAWRDLIEEMIEEGRERGAFDNLRGAGKPLDLARNPFEEDRHLANALLKEHDLLPAWLLKRKAIGVEVQALRLDIGRRWARFSQAYVAAEKDHGRRAALRLGWDNACAVWQEEVTRLNKAIADFNLDRPSDNLELFKLRLDDELRRAGAARALD